MAESRRPAKKHGSFGIRPDGDAYRVTCDCGYDAVLSWPEASAAKLAQAHGVSF